MTLSANDVYNIYMNPPEPASSIVVIRVLSNEWLCMPGPELDSGSPLWEVGKLLISLNHPEAFYACRAEMRQELQPNSTDQHEEIVMVAHFSTAGTSVSIYKNDLDREEMSVSIADNSHISYIARSYASKTN